MTTAAVELEAAVSVAREVVERIVWCTVTTAGADGRPRSRLMHPVWWWDGPAPVALVTSRPTPLKVRHLAASPFVSCFYWDPSHDTVAIDGTAMWVPLEERPTAWASIAAEPPPVGFDPAMIWPDGPDSPDCAFLRLTAHRIVATPAGRAGFRWSSPS
jgi:hypothetical protein